MTAQWQTPPPPKPSPTERPILTISSLSSLNWIYFTRHWKIKALLLETQVLFVKSSSIYYCTFTFKKEKRKLPALEKQRQEGLWVQDQPDLLPTRQSNKGFSKQRIFTKPGTYMRTLYIYRIVSLAWERIALCFPGILAAFVKRLAPFPPHPTHPSAPQGI